MHDTGARKRIETVLPHNGGGGGGGGEKSRPFFFFFGGVLKIILNFGLDVSKYRF